MRRDFYDRCREETAASTAPLGRSAGAEPSQGAKSEDAQAHSEGWKRCCQRFKLLSCLSWRGIFHGNWENKSNFQIGGLREAGGLLLFSPVRAHLLTTQKGRWYCLRQPCALRGGCGSCGSLMDNATILRACCHCPRSWWSVLPPIKNTVALTDGIPPTVCKNLPPAALLQRWALLPSPICFF